METRATTTPIEIRPNPRAFLASTFTRLPMEWFAKGIYHISELRLAGHRGSEEVTVPFELADVGVCPGHSVTPANAGDTNGPELKTGTGPLRATRPPEHRTKR